MCGNIADCCLYSVEVIKKIVNNWLGLVYLILLNNDNHQTKTIMHKFDLIFNNINLETLNCMVIILSTCAFTTPHFPLFTFN